MDENILNKIASVYVFDNTSDFGFYNSYRNFCLKNIIRLDFVYGSKTVRVYSTPEKYTLSDSKSNEIKKYFFIEYVNGDKEYYNFNDELNEIFSSDKSDSISIKPNVISTPYLIFENSNESYKYRVINDIGIHVKNKDFSSIYKYFSDGCIVNYNQISISGLNEVKREIKKRSGFFDSKLKKIKFHNNVMGYLKNDVSDVCLKIEFTDEHHKTTKYLLYFQFNKNSLIEKINIELFDERIPMKMIIDDDLEKLLNSKYNDYNI